MSHYILKTAPCCMVPSKKQYSCKWTNHGTSTSSCVGAATLTARQRLRIAGMTRVDELQHKIRRQVAQYFSIVRLSACWASFVNRSTSVSNTTASPHRTKILKARFLLKIVQICKIEKWSQTHNAYTDNFIARLVCQYREYNQTFLTTREWAVNNLNN